MRLIYKVSAFCAIGLAACNGNTTSKSGQATTVANTEAKAPVQSKLNDTGTHLLMSVVADYYALKNALVATKEGDVNGAATHLATSAGSLQSFIQKDATNNAAIKPYVDTIVTQSQSVTTIKDATCEKQRLAFGTLSSAMYGLLKTAQLKNAKVYHEYCPMAFNDKGATWLSDETDIKNPYFGKKMLECGEVTDSL